MNGTYDDYVTYIEAVVKNLRIGQ